MSGEGLGAGWNPLDGAGLPLHSPASQPALTLKVLVQAVLSQVWQMKVLGALHGLPVPSS